MVDPRACFTALSLAAAGLLIDAPSLYGFSKLITSEDSVQDPVCTLHSPLQNHHSPGNGLQVTMALLSTLYSSGPTDCGFSTPTQISTFLVGEALDFFVPPTCLLHCDHAFNLFPQFSVTLMKA